MALVLDRSLIELRAGPQVGMRSREVSSQLTWNVVDEAEMLSRI